jgi:DNA-binding MarR family transcriptional regulator
LVCINEIEVDEMEGSKLAKAIASECIAHRVRLLNRVITGLYDRALQPFGIKVNQVTILVMLSMAGKAEPSDIAATLLMEKSTVSRNLDRMRKKGWIRIANGDDGLSQVITVTSEGRKLLAMVRGEWMKAQKKASQLLGAKGVLSVRKLHDTMIEHRKIEKS